MLIVTLVATLAAGALWRQWRQVEIESAERARQQIAWLLVGAQDWARLILREDARTGGADHLAEPWAVPLQESRLSSFLAANQQDGDDVLEAFLSGQITDLQSRLNVLNLVENGQVAEKAYQDFARLFRLLDLPEAELDLLAGNLRAALGAQDKARAPLLPQRADQLGILGLSAPRLARLLPHITLLPERTPVNLNTAPAEVLHAVIGGLDLVQARRIVQERTLSHFRTLSDASRLLPGDTQSLEGSRHAVASRYFEVCGRLRYGSAPVEDCALVERNGLAVRTLWRTRVAQGRGTAVTADPVQ
jgi:general secretion pathway protein K